MSACLPPVYLFVTFCTMYVHRQAHACMHTRMNLRTHTHTRTHTHREFLLTILYKVFWCESISASLHLSLQGFHLFVRHCTYFCSSRNNVLSHHNSQSLTFQFHETTQSHAVWLLQCSQQIHWWCEMHDDASYSKLRSALCMRKPRLLCI